MQNHKKCFATLQIKTSTNLKGSADSNAAIAHKISANQRCSRVIQHHIFFVATPKHNNKIITTSKRRVSSIEQDHRINSSIALSKSLCIDFKGTTNHIIPTNLKLIGRISRSQKSEIVSGKSMNNVTTITSDRISDYINRITKRERLPSLSIAFYAVYRLEDPKSCTKKSAPAPPFKLSAPAPPI